jgi:hypothetical protein
MTPRASLVAGAAGGLPPSATVAEKDEEECDVLGAAVPPPSGKEDVDKGIRDEEDTSSPFIPRSIARRYLGERERGGREALGKRIKASQANDEIARRIEEHCYYYRIQTGKDRFTRKIVWIFSRT